MPKFKKMSYMSAAFTMAFASMAYELILAQCTTVLYGGTVFRYSVIIGTFVFSLGMGAAYWAWQERSPSEVTFWKMELILGALGLILPLVVFTADSFVRTFNLGDSLRVGVPVGFAAALLLSMTIGWFSGMELPVLLLMIEKNVDNSLPPYSISRHLVGLDFLGTVLATTLVPIWAYQTLGLLGTATVMSAVNGLLGWMICRKSSQKSYLLKMLTVGLIAVSCLLFVNREEVSAWLAQTAF